jgi:hypothetical protein
MALAVAARRRTATFTTKSVGNNRAAQYNNGIKQLTHVEAACWRKPCMETLSIETRGSNEQV